jgi:5-methylcytosine-specific restriction endonuclease McrA
MDVVKRTKAEAARENLKKAIAARVSKGRTERDCQGCGKRCNVHMAAVRKGWKYCSLECRYKTMVGSKGSNAGGGKWMLGEKNINFRHGMSSELGARDLTKVNRWRRRVFERDKYICQRCGFDKGNTLRAHHIATWAVFPELRYELSNGITLCDKCHKWVHSKKNVNKEFLICK